MKKALRIFKYVFITFLGVFILLALRPINYGDINNYITVSGTLINIEGHENNHDITFSLNDDSNHYYINRGMEAGLDIPTLKSALISNEVEITYVNHWTPLDPMNRVHHIAKLRQGTEVIYNEMKD